MKFLDCERDGMHFLNKLRTDHLSNGSATRAGNKDACISGSDSSVLFHSTQELEDFFRLTRLVALVVLPDGLISRRVNHNRFDSRGTYVQTNQELRHYPLLNDESAVPGRKAGRLSCSLWPKPTSGIMCGLDNPRG